MEDKGSRRSKYEDQVRWSDLSSLVLEKICSFLSRRDQMNMLLVSPTWSHVYESPSLWERFRFTMNKSNIKGNVFSLMNCVHKYSRYFKHVHISFERDMKKEDIYFWSRHLKTFLQILTKTSQIVSLKFLYLGECFNSLNILDDQSICKCICIELDHFFGSQLNLHWLEFYGSGFKEKDGVQLLNKAFHNCKNSLKTLVLRDFFLCFENNQFKEKRDPCVDQLLTLILSLPNLSHLEIDYMLIFGVGQAILSDVFEKLKNCRKEIYLKILTNISDLRYFVNFKFLPPSDWSLLKRQYPNLDMELTVDKFSALRLPLEVLILEHMPISVLSYNILHRYYKECLKIEIDEFLSHIIACKISNTLVSLTLEWSKPILDVSSVLIPFLKVCKKLKKLVLNVVYPSNHLVVLLECLLNDKPPSLNEFELTILDVEEEKVEPLRNLGSEFERRLKAVNLNLKLLVEDIEQEDQKKKQEEEIDSIL